MTTKHDYKPLIGHYQKQLSIKEGQLERNKNHIACWHSDEEHETVLRCLVNDIERIKKTINALKVAQAVTQEPSLEMLDAGIESFDRNGMFAFLSHFKAMRDKMLEGVE